MRIRETGSLLETRNTPKVPSRGQCVQGTEDWELKTANCELRTED
jgi:hypothetical protein